MCLIRLIGVLERSLFAALSQQLTTCKDHNKAKEEWRAGGAGLQMLIWFIVDMPLETDFRSSDLFRSENLTSRIILYACNVGTYILFDFSCSCADSRVHEEIHSNTGRRIVSGSHSRE